VNKPAIITTNLPDDIVQIQSSINTGDVGHGRNFRVYSDEDNHYTISGQILQNPTKVSKFLSLRNPMPLVSRVVQDDLQSDNIKFTGKILQKTAPNSSNVLLATHQSKPLRSIVVTMLKHSDNLYADSLLKTLGWFANGYQGTWQNGVRAMQKVLTKNAKINFKNSLMVDGAGLSRYNVISPLQVSQLLNYIYHDFAIRPELMSALPQAGFDGTLHRRFRRFDDKDDVRGKTGNMTGVSSLAGFVQSKHLGLISYVIMMNGVVGTNAPQHYLQDQIVKQLAGA